MRLSHAKNPEPSDTPRQRDELERFKTAINLTEYAAAEGYLFDRRASSRNSVVMRHPGGDKIVIARGEDDHWIYFSVRDDTDNGSIIDFIQHRRRCSIGAVRQELRPCVIPHVNPRFTASYGRHSATGGGVVGGEAKWTGVRLRLPRNATGGQGIGRWGRIVGRQNRGRPATVAAVRASGRCNYVLPVS